MKIATIVGARPQFIKAAVVSRAFQNAGTVEEVMIHTGQHYDENMSSVFFTEMEIPRPQYNLGVGSCWHGQQTGRMLEGIESVLLTERPEWTVVYGDTNSTLAGALAAAKLHIPVAHIEAGLRSFDRRMPEEINRVLTDHSSDLLFTPTKTASRNLEREGVPVTAVQLVGDVMYDAALCYGRRADERSAAIQRLGLKRKQYVLATLHRAENTDDIHRLQMIVQALVAIAREIQVVLPIHPRTRKLLCEAGMIEEIARHVRTIEPLGYLDMIMLEKNAKLIATDSGGVQKEAFFHGVPCVTLRETTEWTELVEMGWNRLIPPLHVAAIESGLREALHSSPVRQESPYGDGHAAERIVQALLERSRDVSVSASARDAASGARPALEWATPGAA
jgi:UDP-GlcNAc3NAcA epimerase